jgi:CRP-like cAMP-binding protein
VDVLIKIIQDAECKKLKCQTEKFRPGDFVRSAGEEFDEIMILKKGEIKIESVGRSGRILEIDRISAPEFIFPCVTFSENPILDADLIAVTDVEVITIERDEFFKYMWKDKESAVSFLAYLGKQFSKLINRLSEVILSDLKEKIANYLVSLSEEQNSLKIKLPHTREEIARRFGAARPSISIVLSELAEDGLIKLNRNIVEILNITALKKMGNSE